jgi:hypothetical protein
MINPNKEYGVAYAATPQRGIPGIPLYCEIVNKRFLIENTFRQHLKHPTGDKS